LYCNACGEKVIEPKDRSFRTFLSNVMIALTFADNRFVKTLWLVVSRPGFLSREYAEGRRVKYLRPLQLFFILNLIYFLFPVLQLFNSSLRTQMNYLVHSNWVRDMVIQKLVRENISYEGFELMYNDKTTGLAKLLVVVFVLVASLPLSVIFRKKDRFFTDHTTLAVELASFNIFVNALVLSGILALTNALLGQLNMGGERYLNEVSITAIFVCTNLYFLYRSSITFYHQRGLGSVFKSVLGLAGLFVALEAYRLLLFFVTMVSL
jgi:hypothetical protein